MGLFSKKEAFNIPKDAVNLAGDRGFFYIETENGFITKDNYNVANVNHIVAIYYKAAVFGKGVDTKASVGEVIYSKIESLESDLEFFAPDYGAKGICEVKFYVREKDIFISLYDTCTFAEVSSINEEDAEEELKKISAIRLAFDILENGRKKNNISEPLTL